MGPVIIAVKVLVGLALFFGFVISLAVANGIFSSLAHNTERAKQGHIMGSWQSGYVIREYKRLNPDGRKHRHAQLAFGIGVVFGLAFVLWVLILASR